MKKEKIVAYVSQIAFSSFFLWLLLIFLDRFNLKPEIKISLFLFVSLGLLFILKFNEVLGFFAFSLNKINLLLGSSSREIVKENIVDTFGVISIFAKELWEFIGKMPVVLMIVFSSRLFWLGFTGLGIFFDIFVFKFSSSLIILLLAGLWILSVWRYKFGSRVSISQAFILLMIHLLLPISNWGIALEKSIVWVYMFLAVGAGQMLIEYLKKEEKGAEAKKE